MLSVAHVVLSLDCGGLERIVLALIRSGRARGQTVSVVCLERPGELAADAARAGARVHCIDKKKGLRFGTFGRLRELLREIAPDVVHTHQIGPLLYAGRAAHKVGVPVVVHTEHGNHLKNLRPWFRRQRSRLLWRMASRPAARFFCVSQDIVDTLQGAGLRADKLVVVANGIDTAPPVDAQEVESIRAQWQLPAGQPVIGSVGRLSEIKRQDVLLRAMARLLPKWPAARLLLVGDGPERAVLMQLADKLGIGGAVVFAGYQARPELYLRLLDIFALTSRSEGIPLALLEAWAAGKPVVATAVGGIPALVENGKDGLIVPSGDDEGVARALDTLLGNPELAVRMAAAGRAKVCADFGIERMASTYDGWYRDLLARRP